MKTNNNETDIYHNVQIAVDNKAHLVVTVDVTSSPADQEQLSNIAKQAKKEMDVDKITVLANKGYWNGEELKKCAEANITTIVSSPKEQGNNGYQIGDFKYNKENDYYVCPMGKILHKTEVKEIKYVNKKACKECHNRERCTSSKN